MPLEPDPSSPPKRKREWAFWGITLGAAAILLLLASRIPKSGFLARHEANNMVRAIHTALTAFERDFGSLPTGTHIQIVAALGGTNAKRQAYLKFPPKMVSIRGEVLDPWSRPYIIDTSRPNEPRIHSIGPDGVDNGGRDGSDDLRSWP